MQSGKSTIMQADDMVLVPNGNQCNLNWTPVERKRNSLCKYQEDELLACNKTYIDLITELFFLQHGGNYIDLSQFKKRPSQQLANYLKQNPVISSEVPKQDKALLPQDKDKESVIVSKLKTTVLSNDGSRKNDKSFKVKQKLPTTTSVGDFFEDIGSQEEILERAKQEAIVQRRVSELRRQGLWSQRRLPKVQEPPRNKAHWDYLLEEMRWLAADFKQERKWKNAAARKLAKMVANFHKDVFERERRAEREEQQKLRRIASTIARQIRGFWCDIEKVVEYKQRCLLDEKRKKALDLHLNFIVDQTAKYSDWLTKGLTQPNEPNSTSPSLSRASSCVASDDDFMPRGASSDDEETIEVEENAEQDNVIDEIALLKEESEIPFSELLSQIPSEVVENIGKPLPSDIQIESQTEVASPKAETATSRNEDDNVSSDEKNKLTPISLRRSARKRHSDDQAEVLSKKLKIKEETDDAEFAAASDSSDDEATMQEEEANAEVDHEKEIKELQNEGEMPIEELMKLYGSAFESATASGTSESGNDSSESGDDSEDFSTSDHEDISMDYLLKEESEEKENNEDLTTKTKEENKEIIEVAEQAMSLQPTGHTLATTQVVTPIPSLLRHTLREYQHIGLDWLVTMYDKRLNGILADEMGLGKTIQTIALLAHLACDKGVWGPHLIVVPTSVMLNWEMELKKWCPGFKILTYYGTQKERKLKRTGWTKSNAFHVCITSYKLVIQDHSSFRRKKWRYLILDEAQNIKNFKSQRWQTLLNFNSQRRLLLTGTPLQNNLMELWSLMHFLMPHVFQSHKEFKEWFSNPMTGMIEGSQEFNEKLVRRLHQVLRPFLLRRVKKDVEKQMPNKFEHIVRCHLSKRQRFLYEDFMSRAATKEALSGGHFMSVINVLMQLRKVCNHPNLFEPRPIVSPFVIFPIEYRIPCLVHKVLEKDSFQVLDIKSLNLHLPSLSKMTSHHFEALRRFKTPSKLITEIDATSADSEIAKPVVNEKIRSSIRDKLSSQLPANPLISVQASSKDTGGNSASHISSTTGGNSVPTTSSDFTPSTQSITLQYQTAQGTRWATIPNGQIRHLPGGVVQIVTSSSTPRSASVSTPSQHKELDCNIKRLTAEMYNKFIRRQKAQQRLDTLSRLSRINDLRCDVSSYYLTADTVRLLLINRLFHDAPRIISSVQETLRVNLLSDLVMSSYDRLNGMKDILNRFVFVIPKVACSTPHMIVSHPTPWRYYSLSRLKRSARAWLSRQLIPFHKIVENNKVSFPETRLIEYDCGKLQVLNVLLRRFWSEKHRILIFTQMTRVLDILEAFLSHHGYKYLRLDGSTPIEQRMSRMERFNNDPRIFCFILSTRSGGIGVNLTGADTVVFYDSDWNPTMDAQAQDRCHRIGQTRDVHIYRLISENTVEENILKKANQKRLLGDIAIEGGSFTTAFFKQQQIKDLFDDPSGLEELVDQPRNLTARQKAIEAAKSQPEERKELEQALLDTEEKEDAAAATMLKEEQEAVMEEFQDAEERGSGEEMKLKIPKGSKVEEELKSIYDELTPIERYALQYLEESAEAINDMELQLAEDQVEQSKKEWELAHLMALKQQEERRTEEDDEIFYTREGNQNFEDEITGEAMPIWFPPTPPQDEVYMDPSMGFLYDPVPMSDFNLANVMVKSERKRPKLEGPQGPRRKISRLDIKVPKSIFYHPIMSKKKDRQPKQKITKQPKPASSGTPTRMIPPGGDLSPSEVTDISSSGKPTAASPDWIVNEDWALLQAVQQVLEMPLSLVTMMPAHTPNWHLVADVVNAVGCIYRSPKDCKLRFESVLVPREEGKIEMTTPKKKIKNIKFPIKTKVGKPPKMLLAHTSDDNLQFTSLYSRRFDACHLICSKRNPPKNTTGSGQFQRNPKHAAVLNECGINYEKPLHPMQIAAARIKRLASQKKSTGDQIVAGAIQSSHQATNANLPSGATISQHLGGTLVVNGSPVVGKQPTLQMASQGVNQLTAIPLSGGAGSIVVNSAFTRRQPQMQLQASATKLQASKTGTALALRTLPGNASQLQIQQPISCVQSMSLTFTTQSPMVTITSSTELSSATASRPVVTYPVRGGKMQHVRQSKLQSTTSTPTKQQVKPIRVSQQQLTSMPSSSTLMSVAGFAGKKLQLGNLAKMARAVTPQELEMLVKQQRSQIKTVQHRPTQVHIAPIQGQLQPQQVRPHTAQSSTKSLPITVPVSNLVSAVNLGSLTSSAQQKQMIPGQQATLTNPQFIVQQHFMKQRQQQQQSRQAVSAKQTPQKTMYATVPSHQLVVSGGSTTVKMTPQIQAQMLSQFVAQHKQQRRLSNKGTSQPSISNLTVTKVLQSTTPSTVRHTLVPQTAQVTPLPLSGATTIVAPAGVVTQQQRMMTPQRQQMPSSRVPPIAIGQPLSATSSAIVASTPVIMQRSPVVVGTTQVPQQVHIRNTSPAVPSSTSQPTLLIGSNNAPSVAVMTSAEDSNLQPRTR